MSKTGLRGLYLRTPGQYYFWRLESNKMDELIARADYDREQS